MRSFIEKYWHIPAVAAVIILHICMLAGFNAVNFYTYDEAVHMAGGVEILRGSDYDVNPESGVLPQAVAGLPLLSQNLPTAKDITPVSAASYPYSSEMIYGRPPLARKYLDLSRTAMSVFSILCALSVFILSRRIAGKIPALAATLIYAVSPLYVSNGALAVADLPASLFFLLSVAGIWTLFRRVTIWNFAWASLAVSFLFISKMSAVLILPTMLVFIACHSLTNTRTLVRLPFMRTFSTRDRLKKALISTALCMMTGLVVLLTIWAAYSFEYDFPKDESTKKFRTCEMVAMGKKTLPVKAVILAKDLHILPKAYCYGMCFTLRSAEQRWSFLNGDVSQKGFLTFFPQVFIMKTPPPLVILVFAGLGFALHQLIARKRCAAAWMLFPYVFFALFYFIVAMFGNLNIGYRHIMPVMTALLPVCAFALCRVNAFARRLRMLYIIAALLIAWFVLESFSIYPHSMAYFSPLYGGPEQAYKHIADSSVDWGQDLLNVSAELERRGIDPQKENVYFSYFGTPPVESFSLKGIKVIKFEPEPLPAYLFDFREGWYILSVTRLNGIWRNESFRELLSRPDMLRLYRNNFRQITDAVENSTPLNSKYDKHTAEKMIYEFQSMRFELIRQYLLGKTPEFNVNYSVLAYRLSQEEIDAVLSGVTEKDHRGKTSK